MIVAGSGVGATPDEIHHAARAFFRKRRIRLAQAFKPPFLRRKFRSFGEDTPLSAAYLRAVVFRTQATVVAGREP